MWVCRIFWHFDARVLQNCARENAKVQTFVPHLEMALKVIKQQHPYTMTEEEGIKHLKECLFHRLKPNIPNALHYMYDKPDSQDRQLVIVA